MFVSFELIIPFSSGGRTCGTAATRPGGNGGLLVGREPTRMATRRRGGRALCTRDDESSLGPEVVWANETGAAYGSRTRSRRGRSNERAVVHAVGRCGRVNRSVARNGLA